MRCFFNKGVLFVTIGLYLILPMNDSAAQEKVEWLRCDLHNHCEDHDLVEAHVEGVSERLDVIALSNHAQKPIFFEQHRMVEKARQLLPGRLVLFGMEWNAPLGVHANLIFPAGPNEAENAYAFARAHDRLGPGKDLTPEGALNALAALPPDERPVLFFNHPVADQWSNQAIARYIKADHGCVVAGVEALHGHQLHARIAALDPLTYPGSAIGGLSDRVYESGRPFSMLAHSDFHVHKMSHQPDYLLGVFNHSLVGVPSGCCSATEVLTALRTGSSCAAQGHWLNLRDFHIGQAQVGQMWDGSANRGRISLETNEPVEKVELIGRLCTGAPSTVLHEFGPLEAGTHELTFQVPAESHGFVRLRIVAASRSRPHPGTNGTKLFQTSAILLLSQQTT